MKIVRLFIAISISMSIVSCAAMFNGTTKQISIRSNEEDTKLYVNEAYIGKNSGVSVLKKKEDYSIRASKEGCDDTVVPVTKSFDGTTLLGILLDQGIISILIVDGLATGAWQDFDQRVYVVDPVCKS